MKLSEGLVEHAEFHGVARAGLSKEPHVAGWLAELRHKVFARHSNPWSAWSRWLSTPLVLGPLWTRRWSHGAVVAAWMVANPVVFPKPVDEHAWATRAMLGEELWIAERPRGGAMTVNVAASAVAVAALAAARQRRARLMASATAVQMALLLVYWRLMAEHYDEHRARAAG